MALSMLNLDCHSPMEDVKCQSYWHITTSFIRGVAGPLSLISVPLG